MREIKFRIWHVSSKRFLNAKNFWITADFQSYGGKCVPLNPANEIDLDLPPGVFEFIAADLQPDMGNTFVIQQYTGLKDKNGVEIYEGDLLLSAFCRDEENPVEVSWGDKNNGWNVNHRNGQEGPLLKIHQQSYEVVGNIFEGVDK